MALLVGETSGSQPYIRAANQNQHNCNGNDKYVRCFSKNKVKAHRGSRKYGENIKNTEQN